LWMFIKQFASHVQSETLTVIILSYFTVHCSII
jgi:hypothetical protein